MHAVLFTGKLLAESCGSQDVFVRLDIENFDY